MSKFRPIARLGYWDYTVADTVFTLERWNDPKSTES